MGKSKTRILRKGVNDRITTLKRDDAITRVVKLLELNQKEEATDLVMLFGINAEEILEAGASYESYISIRNIFTK